jgi:hypothetical protein
VIITCPSCQQPIDRSGINPATNVAWCASCGQGHALSKLIGADIDEEDDARPVNLSDPPPGAWHIDDGQTVRIGGTTRSPMAFFLVPFTAVWSGSSLGGIYGSMIAKGQFHLYEALFGLPFLIGTIALVGFCLMTIFGKVEVRITPSAGEVFTGVGSVGWTRRFNPTTILSVNETMAYRSKGVPQMGIALEGNRRLVFGSMLNTDRRYFVLHALRATLL